MRLADALPSCHAQERNLLNLAEQRGLVVGKDGAILPINDSGYFNIPKPGRYLATAGASTGLTAFTYLPELNSVLTDYPRLGRCVLHLLFDLRAAL